MKSGRNFSTQEEKCFASASREGGVPVGVEVQAAVGRVLAQESQVLAGAGPPEDACRALSWRRDDHIHPPHLAPVRQVVAENVVKPARAHTPVVAKDVIKPARAHTPSRLAVANSRSSPLPCGASNSCSVFRF